MNYFLDTYAMYEIILESLAYKQFNEIKAITTKLNLMELYYIVAKNTHIKFAEKWYNYFLKFVVEIEDDTIKEAMNFRLKNKKKKLSYVDCISYFTSLKQGAKFLTGDKEFKNMPNVEFVK